MAFLSVLESMRHGEAAALRLNEIDLKPGIISISRSRDSGEDNCAQDCGFGSRDSDAPVGRRSLEATAGKASFGWFRIRFPDPGAEADDGQLVAEARSSSTACRRRIEGHLVQSSSQSSDSAAEVLHHPAHVYRVGTLGRRQLKKGLAEYCGTSVQMVEQSYGRYIRKDFLGPLIAARPKALRATGGKPDP